MHIRNFPLSEELEKHHFPESITRREHLVKYGIVLKRYCKDNANHAIEQQLNSIA
jgi:hypothetical protein